MSKPGCSLPISCDLCGIDAGSLRLAVGHEKVQPAFLKKKPMEFASWTSREILIASFAGVRGAITLAGVLSIPLLLPDGSGFPARYELVFLAAGVILFSLFVGVIMLPLLLQHLEVADHAQQLKEERIARAATAEVAIVAIQKNGRAFGGGYRRKHR
ncbi:Na+/H+ antiporter [Salmonella enterica subsp. enterica]|uniref:Na+/H+ antiporter n=1 Tax=Salmonella enterica I TaxID=59201 RepID=A0A3S4F9K8_SALET|nr:Na+/H+ antiporter [Salmonella enterica subsp. enterica]